MNTTNNHNTPKAFGLHITALREAAGLTKEQLAWKAGVNFTTLWRIEHGLVKRPDQGTLFALAKELNEHPCTLVYYHQLPGIALPEGCPLNSL